MTPKPAVRVAIIRDVRSVAVSGFPHLFMLMGPHSPVDNQSLVIVAEN